MGSVPIPAAIFGAGIAVVLVGFLIALVNMAISVRNMEGLMTKGPFAMFTGHLFAMALMAVGGVTATIGGCALLADFAKLLISR